MTSDKCAQGGQACLPEAHNNKGQQRQERQLCAANHKPCVRTALPGMLWLYDLLGGRAANNRGWNLEYFPIHERPLRKTETPVSAIKDVSKQSTLPTKRTAAGGLLMTEASPLVLYPVRRAHSHVCPPRCLVRKSHSATAHEHTSTYVFFCSRSSTHKRGDFFMFHSVRTCKDRFDTHFINKITLIFPNILVRDETKDFRRLVAPRLFCLLYIDPNRAARAYVHVARCSSPGRLR